MSPAGLDWKTLLARWMALLARSVSMLPLESERVLREGMK
jgi:hypothetical protein